MKEKQNKRSGLKLISVLCAFLVWLMVTNVADPVMTDTIEIPVEIENADILKGKGLTYEVVGKKTATVSYEVNTSNAYRIRSSDFRAYADLTEMWDVTGSIPVKVEVLNNNGYLVSTPVSKTESIKIETEKLQRKRFEMQTTLVGELADGYQVGEIIMNPNHVYIEGPQSLIGQVSGVGIEILLDGLASDIYGTAETKYYDANGNKIVLNSRLTSYCPESEYSVQVLKTKEATLDFEVGGEAASGYRFTGVECDVKSVPLVGLKSALASLTTITIPADVLSVEGASENVELTLNLADYLPEGVSLAGSIGTEVPVTLTVEKLAEEIFTVDVKYDSFTGDENGYVYRAEPGYVTMRVRALQEDLDLLELESGDLSIDVADLEEGMHIVSVALREELDPSYEVIYITSCNVNVTKASAGPGAAAETTAESEAETEE